MHAASLQCVYQYSVDRPFGRLIGAFFVSRDCDQSVEVHLSHLIILLAVRTLTIRDLVEI